MIALLLPRLGASLISFEIASVSGSTISSDSRLAVVSEQLISVRERVRGTFKTIAFLGVLGHNYIIYITKYNKTK